MENMCYICQEHKISEGHETKWCPKNFCKQCGQKGHTTIGCMSGMEDLPFSKKILDKIVSFLNIKDLDKFSKVSKKVFEICQPEILLQKQKLGADLQPITDLICKLCVKRIKYETYYRCNQLQCNETNICDACFDSEGEYIPTEYF